VIERSEGTIGAALPELGGRVLALVGGAAATLALCLPWASEDETVTVGEFGSSQALVRGGDEWTGWNLGGAPRCVLLVFRKAGCKGLQRLSCKIETAQVFVHAR